MGKFVIRETNEKYSFRLKADNGEVVATSQMYKTLQTCKAGIASVTAIAAEAGLEDQTQEAAAAQKNPKFEVYLDTAGDYRFRLKAKNGQIIAASQGYKTLETCLNGVEAMRTNAPEAEEEMEANEE